MSGQSSIGSAPVTLAAIFVIAFAAILLPALLMEAIENPWDQLVVLLIVAFGGIAVAGVLGGLLGGRGRGYAVGLAGAVAGLVGMIAGNWVAYERPIDNEGPYALYGIAYCAAWGVRAAVRSERGPSLGPPTG